MLKIISLLTVVLLAGPAAMAFGGRTTLGGDWRTASREPVGMAPEPANTPAFRMDRRSR